MQIIKWMLTGMATQSAIVSGLTALNLIQPSAVQQLTTALILGMIVAILWARSKN